MTKVIRSWNSSEEVNLILKENAPKGKGFSAWMNRELLESNLMRENIKLNVAETEVIQKSIVTNLGVEI